MTALTAVCHGTSAESNSSSSARNGDLRASLLQEEGAPGEQLRAEEAEGSCAFQAGELIRFEEVRRPGQLELELRKGAGAGGAAGGGCRGAQLQALLRHPLWRALAA